MQQKAAVFGSLVVDLVAWAPRRPHPGETLIGSRFETFPGGKGFNQAVATARLGAQVSMVGLVGEDDFSVRFFEAMATEGIDATGVARTEGPTGIGLPLVTEGGDVSIVGIPGANEAVGRELADAAAPLLAEASICLLQCEVPAAGSLRAAEIAKGALVVLNAAPAGPRAEELMPAADLTVLNEPELEALSPSLGDPAGPAEPDGKGGAPRSADELAGAAAALVERTGCGLVALTMAERGALLVDARQGQAVAWLIGPHNVEAIDATGAGDAFTAALAVAIAEGMPPESALAFANSAGAAAVQVAGAEPSMPQRAMVESLLAGAESPRVVRL